MGPAAPAPGRIAAHGSLVCRPSRKTRTERIMSDKGRDSRVHQALTEDERLLQSFAELEEVGRDSWRIFRIMGEFVEGFEEMSRIGTGVSIFGSARTKPDDPMYQACVDTARSLGEAGFPIITGGGPGIMEAANKGAQLASVPSVGCNIELPFEQSGNCLLYTSPSPRDKRQSRMPSSA